jgi:hypothetical protein
MVHVLLHVTGKIISQLLLVCKCLLSSYNFGNCGVVKDFLFQIFEIIKYFNIFQTDFF